MIVTLSELIPDDAEQLLSLQHQLDRESSFMLLEPGERRASLAQVQDMIANFAHEDRSILIGAKEDEHVVGYLSVRSGTARRNRHSAYIVVGIAEAYQGMGIGTKLFSAMEEWAVDKGIVRLELTVMTHNTKALALYQKIGFSIEGTKHKALYVSGEWVDEYYMGKIIAPNGAS